MTNTTVNTTNGPTIVSVNSLGWPTVETLDWKVLIRLRSYYQDGTRGYDIKVRVYGAFPVFIPDFDARETALVLDANARNSEAKCPVLAKFHRDSIKEVRAALPGVLLTLKEALEAVGHSVSLPAADEWKFSRKAGCGCGCSPGFIGDGRVRVDGIPCDLSFDTFGDSN